MATTIQAIDIFIGHIFDHFQQLGVFTEKMLAGISTVVALIILVLAIHSLVHSLLQQARLIFFQQRVPETSPHHLNNIPAGAAKNPLELLNDFAIAAHWAIKALEIAIDHKNQIVEIFPARQSNGTL